MATVIEIPLLNGDVMVNEDEKKILSLYEGVYHVELIGDNCTHSEYDKYEDALDFACGACAICGVVGEVYVELGGMRHIMREFLPKFPVAELEETEG